MGQVTRTKALLWLAASIFTLILGATLFGWYLGAQSLVHRQPGELPHETCPEHVALSRHWLMDAAKVSPIKWHRTWLRRMYLESLRPERINQVCQDNKTMVQWDLDLGDIRLQAAYDMQRKRELQAVKQHDCTDLMHCPEVK